MHPYRTSFVQCDEATPERTGLPLAFAVLTGVSWVQVVTDLGRPFEAQTVIGRASLIAGIAGLLVVTQRRRTRWPISNS